MRFEPSPEAFERVQCCLCGVDDSELWLRKNYSGIEFELTSCKRCGLVYVNPRLVESKPREQYEDNFGRQLTPAEALSIVENERQLYEHRFNQRLDEIEKHSRPGRILDIGSQFGFFLECARDRGWRPQGVETTRFCAEYSREKLGLDVLNGELKEANFPPGYFQAVTSWHLLEHVPEPKLLLEEVRRVLQKDGLLGIETPNLESRRFKELRENWGQIRPYDHLYYFAQDTLTKLLHRAGFEVIFVKLYGDTRIAWNLERLTLKRIKNTIIRHYRYLAWLKRPVSFFKQALGSNDDKMVFLASPKP